MCKTCTPHSLKQAATGAGCGTYGGAPGLAKKTTVKRILESKVRK